MALFGKKNSNYISSKETKRISKENRRITRGDREKEKPETYSGVGIFKHDEKSG